MAKESKNYDDVLLSKEIVKGMSLNINDQVFFKRILDRQDEVIFDYIEETYKLNSALTISAVQKMLDEQKKEIFARLDSIDEMITAMQVIIEGLITVVDYTKKEVEILKKLNSFWSLALRIAIGIGLGTALIRWLHGTF